MKTIIALLYVCIVLLGIAAAKLQTRIDKLEAAQQANQLIIQQLPIKLRP